MALILADKRLSTITDGYEPFNWRIEGDGPITIAADLVIHGDPQYIRREGDHLIVGPYTLLITSEPNPEYGNAGIYVCELVENADEALSVQKEAEAIQPTDTPVVQDEVEATESTDDPKPTGKKNQA